MGLTLNLTHTVSYISYSTHVVIYTPVFALNEDIALCLGFREASGLIRHCMTCMLRAV